MAGTDSLIASVLVGPAGKVHSLDMTPAMLAKLRSNVAAMGACNVEPLAGDAEQIPLPDASIDVVTSNGVLNLVSRQAAAFAEQLRASKVRAGATTCSRKATGQRKPMKRRAHQAAHGMAPA